MRTNKITFFAFFIAFGCYNVIVQDVTSKQDSISVDTGKKPEKGGGRNIMLNAANNSGLPDVNIGLPATVGGITILKNGLPAVYFFCQNFLTKLGDQAYL